MGILDIESLECSRENFKLQIGKLSFQKGEKIALIGHNGSGKTTLFNSILGFEKYKGSVKILDFDPRKNIKEILPNLSFCMQNPDNQLFCSSVKDDILFAPRNFKIEKSEEQIIIDVCKQVNIAHLLERAPFELSYGEKKSCALAISLAIDPKIIFLDEPFAMLDVKQTKFISNILSSLQDKTMLIATHDFHTIRNICNKALILHKGEMKYFGPINILEDTEFLESVDLA